MRILFTKGITIAVLLTFLFTPIQAAFADDLDFKLPLPTKKPKPYITPPEVGTLPGDFAVNAMGAGTYSIPIDVPPGSAGIEPNLALSYNSQMSNGLFGMGWMLSGLSEITRCGADIMRDGFVGSVRYNANDRFCLDGKRLVAISGADGANGTVYRTDPDEFSRITSYGTAGSGPAYFEVRTKDGLIYSYGGDATRTEGRIEAEFRTDGSVRVWAVNLIQNRKGAYLDVTYDEHTPTGEYSPYEIHYTGNFLIAQPTYNKVQFTYQGRPDNIQHYDGGSLVATTRRITSIKTFINSNTPNPTLVSDYKLIYENSASTQRSRLVSVQKCAVSGECLPATTFGWTGSTQTTPAARSWSQWGGGFGGLTHITEQWMFSGFGVSCCSAAVGVSAGMTNSPKGDSASVSIQAGVTISADFHRPEYDVPQDLLGDFNGDGKQDVVQIQGSTGRAFAWLSNGSSFVNIGNETNPSATGFNGAGAIVETIVADFNGDGWDDLAWFPDWAGQWPAYVWISQGNGFFSGPTNWGNQFSLARFLRVGDFNGDGKADLASLNEEAIDPNNKTLAVWLSTGSGFTSSSLWLVHTGTATLGDFNGDAMTDVVTFETTANQPVNVHLSHGTELDAPATWLLNSPNLENQTQFVGDFNADGKDDLGFIFSVFDINEVRFAYSDGALSFALQPSMELNNSDFTFINCFPECAPKGDIALRQVELNGDGKTDLLKLHPTLTNIKAFESRSNTWSAEYNWSTTFFGDLYEYAMGDVDGDGRTDVIRFEPVSGVNPAKVWQSNNVEYPDLMKQVKNGYGHITNAVYKPLTDPNTYSGPTTLSGFDQYTRNVWDTRYVVDWFTTSNGIGSNHKRDFMYSGAKEHTGYRSFLGFSQIEIRDTALLTTEYAEYYQTFPLNGIKKSHRTDVDGPMGTISETEDTWNSIAHSVSGGTRYVNQLFSHVEKTYDDGMFKYIRTDNYSYDAYNNPLHWEKTWQGIANEESHDMEYDNDAATWLIGLPKMISQTQTTPGFPFSTWTTRTTDRVNDIAGQTGLLLSEKMNKDGGDSYVLQAYSYDAYGNREITLEEGTDIVARTRTTEYDARGQFPIWQENEKGHKTYFVYNTRFGGMSSMTDPNNQTTGRSYDLFGRLVNESYPDGTAMDIAYSVLLLPLATQSPTYSNHIIFTAQTGKAPIVTYFDNNSREIRRATQGFDGQTIYTDTTYDYAGRIDKKSKPYFSGATPQWTSYYYDEQGRIETVVEPNESFLDYSYTSDTTLVPNTLREDEPGQFQVVEENALNQKKVLIFNVRDELIQSQNRDATNTLVSVNTYVHDGFGNLSGVEDAGGDVTTLYYDDLGRRTGATSSDFGSMDFQYDILGNLVHAEHNGKITDTDYDVLNRPIMRTQAEGVTSWTYDTAVRGIGKLNQITAPNSYSWAVTFDTFSRPSTVTTTIDGTSYNKTVTYDEVGRLKTLTYPGTASFSLRYGYNAYGYLEKIETNTSPLSLKYWQATAMNARNQLTGQTLGNGVQTTYTYHPTLESVTDINSGVGGGSSLQNLDYQYDVLGNLKTRADNNIFNIPSEVFYYDDLNRIESSNIIYAGCGCIAPQGQIALAPGTIAAELDYQYDPNGNITYRTGVGSYTYGENGAGTHAVTTVDNGGLISNYHYDVSGNMTGMPGVTLAWDTNNKPTTITKGIDQWLPFYDPSFQKYKEVHKQNGATVDTTVYIDQLYEKTTTSAGLIEQRYYVAVGDQIVAMYTQRSTGTNDTRYFSEDALGSQNVITDQNGQLVEKLSFDAFGKRRNANWTDATGPINSLTRYGFTGHEHFDEFGVIDARGRLYQPHLGRFISPDPFVMDIKDTQDLNRYSYVRNSPMNFTDPSGYGTCPPDCPEVEVLDDSLTGAQNGTPVGVFIPDETGGYYFIRGVVLSEATIAPDTREKALEAERVSEMNGDNKEGLRWVEHKLRNAGNAADKYFKKQPEWHKRLPPIKLAMSGATLFTPEATFDEKLKAAKDIVDLNGTRDFGKWVASETKHYLDELRNESVKFLLSPTPEGVQGLEPPPSSGQDNTYVAPPVINTQRSSGPLRIILKSSNAFYQSEVWR